MSAANYFKVDPLRQRLWLPAIGPEETEESEDRGHFEYLPRKAPAILAKILTFHDEDEVDTRRAWSHAWALSGETRTRISVYRAFPREGPWRWLAIIGLPASKVEVPFAEVQAKRAAASEATRAIYQRQQGVPDDGRPLARQELLDAANQAEIDYRFCQAWRGLPLILSATSDGTARGLVAPSP